MSDKKSAVRDEHWRVAKHDDYFVLNDHGGDPKHHREAYTSDADVLIEWPVQGNFAYTAITYERRIINA